MLIESDRVCAKNDQSFHEALKEQKNMLRKEAKQYKDSVEANFATLQLSASTAATAAAASADARLQHELQVQRGHLQSSTNETQGAALRMQLMSQQIDQLSAQLATQAAHLNQLTALLQRPPVPAPAPEQTALQQTAPHQTAPQQTALYRTQ